MVIVGAGPGLGRETAEVARREGARVALGARDLDRVTKLAAALDGDGDQVIAEQVDVADRQSCQRFMAQVAERLGRLHALVDVAALETVSGGIEDADWDAWHQTMEVNFFGAAYLAAAALPHLEDGASIVYVGSQTMWRPPRQVAQTVYSASKAAVIGAMRHMTVELGQRRIRVNTVAPGWMWGPAVEGYVRSAAQASGQPEEAIRGTLEDLMPLGDLATDGDVAEVIAFLASERARGVTGQTLLVNAGEHMQ
jgi:NAD(P)-dependent dehydrogenase (short-subunit alcohol dehydrogenase family)